jgi:anthranilate synthase component 2
MKIALIDNHDSFVYNLAQLVREQPGTSCDVLRADRIVTESLDDYEKILFSPGPGLPAPGGAMDTALRRHQGRKAILGVCLGHQAIARFFGARLVSLPTVCHGLARPMTIVAEDYLFAGIDSPFTAGLYYSWSMAEESLPECLTVTARAAEGTIMAVAHESHDIRGVQFHPESIMTRAGRTLIANWLRGPAGES